MARQNILEDKPPYSSLKFRHSWRPYQKRVLNAVYDHLDDNRIHIVAAPGAGKTTLGIEIFRMLRKPALVLSPTRVIRDQWISRLADFSESDEVDALSWVSKSIFSPAILTSVTYQSIHSQMGSSKAEPATDNDQLEEQDANEILELEAGAVESNDVNKFIDLINASAIGVIILDEAHHLRAEWWKVLDKICTAIPETVLVSLTATPPYEATNKEWLRYERLCGTIDEEISIPELVKAGTLCPHQDYLWAVDVSSSEKKKVAEYDLRVSTLCSELIDDATFENIVISHPWIGSEFEQNDLIKHPELALSLIVFMNQKKLVIPEGLLAALDIEPCDIPELSRRWWQELIESVFYSNTFNHSAENKEWIVQLQKQLRAAELLYKRELSLERSRRLDRSLALSSAKIDGCAELHRLEYKNRSAALRQVILVDYIRDEAIESGFEIGAQNLGACPVFACLIKSSEVPNRIGLLSGRYSLIPKSLRTEFLQCVNTDKFKLEDSSLNKNYYRISGPLNQQTLAFTQLLQNGSLLTLVGTRSLLGEGWDAPVINSLVLASAVGSYMLTNQMRGRAIRVDKTNKDKISSIWHLVALDEKSDHGGWGDLSSLVSRFDTFVGISNVKATIESGFERISAKAFKKVDSGLFDSRIAENNRVMKSRYLQITSVARRWQDALTLDESARVVPSVTTPPVKSLKGYHLKNTLKYLLAQISMAITIAFSIVFYMRVYYPPVLLILVVTALFGAILYKLPQTVAAVRILLKHLPAEGSLKQIGLALSETLCKAGFIQTEYSRANLSVVEGGDGTFHMALTGCSFYESSLFADSLAELMAPIDSPRYLIVRKGKLYGMKRDDFHSVPIKLATKKELAEMFYISWCKYVGPSELIYTRTEIGRSKLLKAKMKALSSIFTHSVKRQDRWQS